MLDKIILGVIIVIGLPGLIFALILGIFKEIVLGVIAYGDGTGNESGMAGFFLTAIIVNVLFYIWLGFYLFGLWVHG